jgi:hypothetical protein
LQSALAALKAGEATALVVVKLDRLSRSTTDVLDFVERSGREGWALHSLAEKLDTASAMGRFVVTVFAALAQAEREVIGERTRADHGAHEGRTGSASAPSRSASTSRRTAGRWRPTPRNKRSRPKRARPSLRDAPFRRSPATSTRAASLRRPASAGRTFRLDGSSPRRRGPAGKAEGRMNRTNGNFNPRPPRGVALADGTPFVVYEHLAQTVRDARRDLTLEELIKAATPAVAKHDPSYAANELPKRAALFFRETKLRKEGRGGGGRAATPYPVGGGGIVFGANGPKGESTLRFDPNGKASMKSPKRRPKLDAESSATLDRLAERLKALPADRREAFERDVLKSARKAEGGGRTGRPPIHGESMTTPVLVRVTPAMRRDMEKAAERFGAPSVPDYLRKLHGAFMAAERMRPEAAP